MEKMNKLQSLFNKFTLTGNNANSGHSGKSFTKCAKRTFISTARVEITSHNVFLFRNVNFSSCYNALQNVNLTCIIQETGKYLDVYVQNTERSSTCCS